MVIFAYIPLFALLLLAYNILILFGKVFGIQLDLNAALFMVHLMSGAKWSPTVSDILLAFGVFALYVEIFKATRTSVASIIDHSLSMLVFVIFLVQFIVMPGAGNSTFLLLTIMSFFDVIAGFTITISTARRDFNVSH